MNESSMEAIIPSANSNSTVRLMNWGGFHQKMEI
jgi:hypothetical protein